MLDSIGVWRGVSKGVEDGCRPPALGAALLKQPQGSFRASRPAGQIRIGLGSKHVTGHIS
jgi:hypothetical protein